MGSKQERLGRLGRLVSELDADARYAVGSRRFPGFVSADDSVDIAEALAGEFDRGVEKRASYAAAQGLKIACGAGCTSCCTVVVTTYRPEALRIARFLLQPENAAVREAFFLAYASWREKVGDEIERLPELFKSGTAASYDALHHALWEKGVLCAFNKDGLCSIYPVRPLGCRNAHALDTHERCVPNPPDGRPAAAAEFIPLKDFLQKATRLLRATHNATAKERHHQEAVCSAVYKLLQGKLPKSGGSSS